MHKYRTAARRAAWYNDLDEEGTNYNPFRKFRYRPSQPVVELLSATHTEDPEARRRHEAEDVRKRLEEEMPAEERIVHCVEGARISSRKQRQFIGILWSIFSEVWQNLADMGKSVTSHAHSVPQDAPLLEVPSRPMKFMVIEYAKQEDDMRGNTTGFRKGKPRLRFHESQSPGNGDRHQPEQRRMKPNVESLWAEMSEHLSSRPLSEDLPEIRIIYIQDDSESLRHIHETFQIRFARNRHGPDLFEWSTGSTGIFKDDTEQHIARQTDFWKPIGDRSYEIVRTAFGLEYLVPQPPAPFISKVEGESGLNASKIELQDVPDCGLHRLAVYIQLNKAKDQSVRLGSSQEDRLGFTLDNSIIICDSMYKGVSTAELVSGRGAWQYLCDDLEVVDTPILSATIQLIFDTVAEKWSVYVRSMHNHIAALEAVIYDQPADDTRAPTLWSISKRLLQAERLMKFHVLLLENIQRDLAEFTGNSTRPDWLEENLTDFKRLSSEVEEMLKKPVTNMVDLMYKSISIRDARQSLELNTSMWRLSWITFIFLPLTFLAGVFGMNVSELTSNPPLKWYFISASPLMVFVMISWLSVRKWMSKDVDAPRRLTTHLSRKLHVKAEPEPWSQV